MPSGPGFDHAVFKPTFSQLADTVQIVYFDNRGNGRSDGAPETWNLAQWGDDVKGLCDALFRGLQVMRDDEDVLIGLPDTVWFPAAGFSPIVTGSLGSAGDGDRARKVCWQYLHWTRRPRFSGRIRRSER